MRMNWIALPQPDAIRVGDLVSVEAGGLPLYRVLAAAGGEALLRDEQRRSDWVSPLSRFHWKACIEP